MLGHATADDRRWGHAWGTALGAANAVLGDLVALHLGDDALVYHLEHEGRGVGLVNKLRAYQLQDEGLDTFEANHAMHLPSDSRTYGGAVAVLKALGIERVRLLTRNPQKVRALVDAGLVVEDVIALDVPPTEYNRRYLDTKVAWFAKVAAGVNGGLARG